MLTRSLLTVNSPAATNDLTTLKTVKSELKLTDTSRDAQISDWIRQASGIIAAYCKRTFGQETVTEIFRQRTGTYNPERGRYPDVLLLERYPIASISSIIEDGTTLTTDLYEIDTLLGGVFRLTSDQRTTWCAAKTTVSYTGGYALLDGLPYELERACVLIVKEAYFAAMRDPKLKSQAITGVISEDYWVGGLGDLGAPSPEVVALISPYRNLRI